MASSQKKKTNTKTKAAASKSTRSRRETAPEPKRTYRREIGAAVCLLLALCVAVSYFSADAFFLAIFATVLKGSFGYGYWAVAIVLAVAGVNLLRHRDRPVTLRTMCTLLLPLIVGVLCHVLLCRESYALGTADLLPSLWRDGQLLKCGGAVSGLLAAALLAGFGKIVSAIVFAVALVGCVFGAFHLSPEKMAQSLRERREARLAEEEAWAEEEDGQLQIPSKPAPAAVKKPAARRSTIDIPLDDELPAVDEEIPVPEIKPEKKSFFIRKSDDVRTPDQVLKGESVSAAEEQAAAAPAPEKKKRRTKAEEVSREEVQQATEEVSRAIEEELAEPEETYQYPPITLLDENSESNYTEVGAELRSNSRRLAETLRSFGVEAKAGEVVHGPSVTRYEFTLDQGVKLSKITNLADDIALALGASGVRIAPIPNKISVVGIEVPNRAVSAVRIRDVIESRAFTEHTSSVAFAVGKDIGGNHIVGNIAALPHVLIAGTTGSGKSVCTNSLIVSLLYKSTPEEVRFIMVDPKMVELAPYNGIPHLLIPVVTDPKKAAGALQWAVFEMMKRYKLFSEKGVKKLAEYNALAETDPELKKLPTVVVVIDELADLMLVAAKEVEESICRVAQMGRAAGMHLVIATQRPSSDVITGLMKANIPSRIAFAVASSLESRIILDTQGAEKLVGRGDMLYFPLGTGKPQRVQGCFITPEEIERVVSFVKESGEADYSTEVMEKIEEAMRKDEKGGDKKSGGDNSASADDGDELLPAAVEVVLETGQASVSMLQRRLKLGYSRAARLVDQMEERGIVGPFEGSKPRQLLIDRAKWQEMQMASAQPEPTFDRSGSISDMFESHDALE
ncbi:MAG: DNA translocase FtsK [Ruminococcaceae bacterium]|nr:DNA translocase FtsK [Oscillospiraceae bacterium]